MSPTFVEEMEACLEKFAKGFAHDKQRGKLLSELSEEGNADWEALKKRKAEIQPYLDQG